MERINRHDIKLISEQVAEKISVNKPTNDKLEKEILKKLKNIEDRLIRIESKVKNK